MENEENKSTPLLEYKDKDKEKIEFDLEEDLERVAVKRRRYPFFALLAFILLILTAFFLFKANKPRAVDTLLDTTEESSEIWQGAFSSKETFDAARASSVSVLANGKVCSGFVFSADGWIATAEGIVNEYVEGQIEIYLSDGRRFLVDAFKQDRESGLILMKINAKDLTPVNFSNSALSVGEELFTFCPVDNDLNASSLFCGRLSHSERTAVITRADGRLTSLSVLQIAFLLTEEGVGTPLYNANGELVGIALAQSNGYNERFMINYALPSTKAINILSVLHSDKNGK